MVYFPKDAKSYREFLITFRLGSRVFEFPWTNLDRR